MTLTPAPLPPRDLPRPFDVAAARRDVPILSRTVNGRPLIYLDSAASAQKPSVVGEAMVRAMSESYANVHRGLHTLSNETTDAFERARRRVAAFLGARAEEIVFTKGATEAINLVASSMGLLLREGDEIVLSEMEHHANIVPWHFLRERKGIVLKFVPVTDEGALDMQAFEQLLGPRTRMVALTHMSNVTGALTDGAEIVRAARRVGARVLLDGSQRVAHEPVDVGALGCDFYVFSGHKLYGPTGVGVLFGRSEALAELPPYQGGGEMIASVALDAITYADPPHRFEAGTPAILEVLGLEAAIGWLEGFDRGAVVRHEQGLYHQLRDALAGENGIRELGTTPDKGAIFSFAIEGVHAHDLAQILDRYAVAVRAGAHCAEPLMRRFGVVSSVRASFALYNTSEEVDAFVDALARARRFFA